MKQKVKLLIFAFFILSNVYSIFARDVELIIMDMDLGLPLEGAIVRLWDGSERITGADGKIIIDTPDRQVVIQAAYPGYDNGRLIFMPGVNTYTLGLRLSGIMESRELVIEASKPGTSETKTGRSVAVSGQEIAQTAEIGLVEDVMSSIKLLPGVGYTGFMNAMPSIRGGDPRDTRASLNGFYVFSPYYWGGGYSIFDPRTVESAQLSHGVFSSRHGNSISGLLEITSKKPSPTETEFELGVNTSAANFNLSLPLFGKGGVIFTGRITYYDPLVKLAQAVVSGLDIENLDAVNGIRQAPYIRGGSITGNYRFLDNLELDATGFLGMDGIGYTFEDSVRTDALNSDSKMVFDWTNYNAFITAGLSWNPRNDMLVKFTTGVGYQDAIAKGDITDSIHEKAFVKTSANEHYYDYLKNVTTKMNDTYKIDTLLDFGESDKLLNVQGRLDYDWELGKGFLAAIGVQETMVRGEVDGRQAMPYERLLGEFSGSEQDQILNSLGITDPVIQDMLKNSLWVSFPVDFAYNEKLQYYLTSGYGLVEYNSPNNRFNTELGLRIDHILLNNEKGFSLQSKPVLNPRLNVDFNVFKNRWIIESLNVSAGTGLFSSIHEQSALVANKNLNLDEFKPLRSWTSVLGTKLELGGGFTFNIEGYYKYIFDRTYIPVNINLDEAELRPYFNGDGKVWGIDVMLQKTQARFWDGWLSYSWNWTKHRDPNAGNTDMGMSGGVQGNDDWYFPEYHRFHNLNVVLNFKPAPKFNIYTRFGIASGVQIEKRTGGNPVSIPVYDADSDQVIEKYYWPTKRDESERTTPSFPLDIKFSIFGNNNSGKTRYEVYVAVENLLAMIGGKGNSGYNQYTGEVDNSAFGDSYDLPIPIPSFGFKISY